MTQTVESNTALGPPKWGAADAEIKVPSDESTIPFQNSTKNHTILLSVRTRLLELLCVFNCSFYFSSCKTACDLHLCVSECVCVCVCVGERERERETETETETERERERERERMKLQWFDFQPFGMYILVACNS